MDEEETSRAAAMRPGNVLTSLRIVRGPFLPSVPLLNGNRFKKKGEELMTSRRTIAVVTALVVVVQNVAQAGIVGSKHDFTAAGWSNHQICLPCHTPHNAIVKDSAGAAIAAPLWNHTLAANGSYQLYYDASGSIVRGSVDQNSLLCLSCHDGTIALDSFGGGASGNVMTPIGLPMPGQAITGKALIGTDLTNDHPIGEAAVWPSPTPSYMVDPSLRAAAGTMPLRKLSDGRLSVGCSSCHEPHNRKNTTHMLWVENAGPATTVDGRNVSGSVLCMNCHIK
jgi:hypothetical protein